MQSMPGTIDWHGVRRIGRNIAIAVTVVVGAVVLLRQAGTLGPALASISHADPFGLFLTGVFGASTYVAAAVAITAASGLPLPLWRTSAAQLAAASTNRIAPAGIGGMATNLRYLEGSGATRSQAVTAIGLTSVASFAVHSVATIAALALSHRPLGVLVSAPASLPWPVMFAGALVVTATGIVMARQYGSRAKAAARESWATVSSMGADRPRLARMLGGTIGVTLGHGLAFAAAVTACGAHLPLVGLLGVFLAGSAVASVAPTPGGLGALEAALVAGLTTLGAAAAPAVAGVLTYRLITYWLPIIPGALALSVLRCNVLAGPSRRLEPFSALSACEVHCAPGARAARPAPAPRAALSTLSCTTGANRSRERGFAQCSSPRADARLIRAAAYAHSP